MSLLLSLALLPGLISPILAQTWTNCNPHNETNCPADTALGIRNATYNFVTSSAGSTWNTTNGNLKYGTQGAEFTINRKGDAPTIQTNFYIFFGEVEVWMKAAPGRGVVSTIVLESDDLDEVDLEIIGSNATHVENNYYGKGNKTNEAAKAKWYPTTTPQDVFHNYTTKWTKDTLEWYIDGNVVRTLAYADAVGGKNYPQSPMNVRIGVWAAGDPNNNNYTVAWAGGEIDYSKGPYTMYVQSARITDYSTGSEYMYGDKTGSWQSINIVAGNSTAAKTLSAPPPVSMAQRWAGLPTGAKIGIYAGVAGVASAIIALWALCCIKHRRAGRKEGALADAAFEKDTAELLAYRAEMGSARRGF